MPRRKLDVRIEPWRYAQPLKISGLTLDQIELLVCRLEEDGAVGEGEAFGVYYRSETALELRAQVEAARSAIEAGVCRLELQSIMQAGGARNALDCAFWDLEAKLSGVAAWQAAGLDAPRPLVTTLTCGAAAPEAMARRVEHEPFQAIKLKLIGELLDGERVAAVRAARPDVWLAADANQGFSLALLDKLMPAFLGARVALIEQPLRPSDDAKLESYQSPIPIAADESVQHAGDLGALAGRFDVFNIKLDKCGGLTSALQMAREGRRLGLRAMVGCMPGTSLAMAPAWLVGQSCEIVDLDGPYLLGADRDIRAQYDNGYIDCSPCAWGAP